MDMQQESLSERPAASASAVSQAEDVAAKIFHAFSQTLPKDSSQDDVLGSVVRQLARCRLDELEKLARHKGQRKQLAIYRSVVFPCVMLLLNPFQKLSSSYGFFPLSRPPAPAATLKELKDQSRSLEF